MSINEIEELLDTHWKWIKDKTILRQMKEDWIEVTTPYLDRHNDCLQIYIKKEGAEFILTDDSYIINDLINSGLTVNSPKRKELLGTTLAGFGVQLVNGQQLQIHTNTENFPLKKHNFIQAMLAVNDLFYLASPFVANLFIEDVTNWMDVSNIRYTPKIKFTGKSGYDHMFDFVLPKSNRQPERIVQAIPSPKKESAELLVFKWMDTRETRIPKAQPYALLNDNDLAVSGAVIGALKNYEIETVLWSNREKVREILAA